MFQEFNFTYKLNSCELKFYNGIKNLEVRGQDNIEKFALLKNDLIEILRQCKKEKNEKNGFMSYQKIHWQYIFLSLANREKLKTFNINKLKIDDINETYFDNQINLKVLSGKPQGDGGPYDNIYDEANLLDSFITALFIIKDSNTTHRASDVPPMEYEIDSVREVIDNFLKSTPETVVDTIKRQVNKIYEDWTFEIEYDIEQNKEIKYPKDRPIFLFNSKLLIWLARGEDSMTTPTSKADIQINGISIETFKKR